MTEVSTERQLFSEKLHRFGAVGVGIIGDSMSTLRLAEARVEEARIEESKEASSKAVGGYSVTPVAKDAPVALTPAAPARSAVVALVYKPPTAERAAATAAGDTLTRDEILSVLAETVRVQGIVQQEVSVLARKLAKEQKGDKKKKKPYVLAFTDGHKKIVELKLPQEPLEDYGLSEGNFQRLLMEYEQDEEVMIAAQQLLHPAGKGDPERARGITMDKIIEIHQFMVGEMQKVLNDFLQLPQESRRSFTGKGCETTAELLVSIAVEQQLSVRCEDVEQAVIMYEDSLQGHPDFASCTEQLACMMQHLIGATQPRVEKEEFIKILNHMGDSTKQARTFGKQLYEDYRSKKCGIDDAYTRFAKFSEESFSSMEALALPDLSSVEMQLCWDEYRDNPEVKAAWEHSGAESNLMMQTMMTGRGGPGGSRSSSSSVEDKPKGKKLKVSEIVEMQELMVDELKRCTEAAAEALTRQRVMDRLNASKSVGWRAELAVQMVQALASAAVERRYGTSAEEMTTAGFTNAATLQRNERFVRATEKQQELLMQIPRLCGSG